MTSHEPHSDQDAGIEALLRQAGAREEPAASAAHDVRRAVRAEWLIAVEERKRRRAWTTFGMAASAALVMLFAALIVRTVAYQPAEAVATVTRFEGAVRYIDSGIALKEGSTIAVGARMATGDDGRFALALGSALSVRVDRNSLIAFTARDRIELIDGALYVDAAPGAAHTALNIDTQAGSVAHLGTQFQVRDLGPAIAVSVREGSVQITHPSGAHTALAGERIELTARGRVQRSRIAAHDASWAWTAAAAPVFDIEGRALSEFLEWTARQTGRRLVYRSAQAQRAAREIRLRGSVAHLDPETALTAVLATTPLQRDLADPGAITLFLSAE